MARAGFVGHTHCAVKVVLILTKAVGQFACLIQLVVHF